VWWSRTAQPDLHSWAASDEQLHLEEKAVAKSDPDPTAVACYGLLLRATVTTSEQIWLRFASGQPVSDLTTQFLEWCSERLAAQGKRALLMVWDNASWHKSQLVRSWIRRHNRQVKADGSGVRIVACLLPSKSPWLNPIEPKWVHGKRAVLEPARVLSKQELADRVYAYYGCSHDAYLSLPEKAA
jgi:transposase